MKENVMKKRRRKNMIEVSWFLEEEICFSHPI